MRSHQEKKPDGTPYRPGERLVMDTARKAAREYSSDESDDEPGTPEKFDPIAEIEAMAAKMSQGLGHQNRIA